MAEPEPRRRRSPVYRRCPECGAVRKAAELPRATGLQTFGGLHWSRCPDCGHKGPTATFPRLSDDEVREMEAR